MKALMTMLVVGLGVTSPTGTQRAPRMVDAKRHLLSSESESMNACACSNNC